MATRPAASVKVAAFVDRVRARALAFGWEVAIIYVMNASAIHSPPVQGAGVPCLSSTRRSTDSCSVMNIIYLSPGTTTDARSTLGRARLCRFRPRSFLLLRQNILLEELVGLIPVQGFQHLVDLHHF